jgi:hypothetical protein
MTALGMRLLLALALALAASVRAQRDAGAERGCQALLVGPASPLLAPGMPGPGMPGPGMPGPGRPRRNLTADEDGEFECELVLQDRQLPPQIRLTVRSVMYMYSLSLSLYIYIYILDIAYAYAYGCISVYLCSHTLYSHTMHCIV